MSKGWVGIDLDGTLAKYDTWHGIDHIGEPISYMLGYVSYLIAHGIEVKIVTARVQEGPEAIKVVKDWCKKYIGLELDVTDKKDISMVLLVDDRVANVNCDTCMEKYNVLSVSSDVENHWKGSKAPPLEFAK